MSSQVLAVELEGGQMPRDRRSPSWSAFFCANSRAGLESNVEADLVPYLSNPPPFAPGFVTRKFSCRAGVGYAYFP